MICQPAYWTRRLVRSGEMIFGARVCVVCRTQGAANSGRPEPETTIRDRTLIVVSWRVKLATTTQPETLSADTDTDCRHQA